MWVSLLAVEPMTQIKQILLISGSLRRNSTNTAAVKTIQKIASREIKTTLYAGLDHLPHFNPDDDYEPLHPAVVELRAQIMLSDALLFSTPEFAGALPGSFKNLLDWTVGGGEIYQKPVAWINVSSRGAIDAHESLKKVLGYVGAHLVEAACAHIPVLHNHVDDDGLISEAGIQKQLVEVVNVLSLYAPNGERQETMEQ